MDLPEVEAPLFDGAEYLDRVRVKKRRQKIRINMGKEGREGERERKGGLSKGQMKTRKEASMEKR